MTRRGGGRRLEGTCVPALLYTATCSGEGSAGRQEVPVSTHGGLGGGAGEASGTTGHPEGGDRARAERAGSCEAPLRLERYVRWNLNTGCEVQRKGMEAGGGRDEGKERARPVRPGVINPFRAMQSEPGRQEARVPPSHGQAKPSPPRSHLCQTGARSGCNAAGPEDPAPRPRESDGQGSRDGHHG